MTKSLIVGAIGLLSTPLHAAEQIRPWPAICLQPEQFVELVDNEQLSLEITSPPDQQLIGSVWSSNTGTFVFTVLDTQEKNICILLAFKDGKRIIK